MESVPTEEEAAEYLKQLVFEEEEQQISQSCFFFRGGRHRRLVCFPCYEIQKYDRMCLLSVNSSTLKQGASNQRIKSCLFIDNKYFCLAFFSKFLENQNSLHFFLKSIDLVRNINPITSYFVSNLDLATTLQRPTSVRWQAIAIGGKRNLVTHFSDLRD